MAPGPHTHWDMQQLATLFADSSFDWWDVLLAVVVAVGGWLASRYAQRGVQTAMERWSGLGAQTSNLAGRVIRYALLLLTLGIVLTVLGAPLQPVLAAVIVVVAVAALALRGIASNFGAGIVIQARRPVVLGEAIRTGAMTGTVHELNARSIVLTTSDGTLVHIPNTTLLEQPLTNFSRTGANRFEVYVITGTGTPDLGDIGRTAAAAVPSGRADALLVGTWSDRACVRVRYWAPHGDRDETASRLLAALVAEPAVVEGAIDRVALWPRRCHAADPDDTTAPR